GPCQGLECAVPVCAAGTTTSISGKVFAPNGTLPLYNVVVYVPNDPVLPFTEGVSCDRCGASITNPVTAAITDESGSFKLENAPAGADIPLVMQVGKWRRQITVPNVTGCVDTPLTDPQLTRLPKTKSEGDLPRIAIAAGGADAMECLPRKLGIDDAEFTTNAGEGRIHLYTATDNETRQGGQGNQSTGDISIKAFAPTLNDGVELPHSTTLWDSVDTLKKYDIVVLACEGAEMVDEKPTAARQAMYDYLNAGGRVFASHFAHVWFSQGPAPVPTTGTWRHRNGLAEADEPMTATINQTFPKGEALAKWLVNVGASMTQGELTVIGPRDEIQAVDPLLARDWITLDNPASQEKVVEYMSFNAPLGATEEQACGRAVFTGLHVSNSVESRPQPPGFPGLCTGMDMSTELSAQEKAVAFMLFDLSSCIQSDEDPPRPPR
ncbi:MAG TPA: carboxypeptidase regulatory-like domain-containing protein, partial [Polyangiaceae bacterium]